MITIKCVKCKTKIISYMKIGKGKLLRCYKKRIKKYYLPPKDNNLICECGNILGKDFGRYYKMNQSTFIYSGKVQ